MVCPSDMIALGDGILLTDSARQGSPLQQWPALDAFGKFFDTFYKSVMPGLPANDSGVRAMKQRHGGRWNIGFCDGHVENLRPSGLFDAYNPIQMQRWNNDHQPHHPDWMGGQ